MLRSRTHAVDKNRGAETVLSSIYLIINLSFKFFFSDFPPGVALTPRAGKRIVYSEKPSSSTLQISTQDMEGKPKRGVYRDKQRKAYRGSKKK